MYTKSCKLYTVPYIKYFQLKKSLSNAEDRRRKSLLPWHRKLRSKSRDRCFEDDEDESLKNGQTNDGEQDVKGSNSSLLTSWDVARGLNSKQVCSYLNSMFKVFYRII